METEPKTQDRTGELANPARPFVSKTLKSPASRRMVDTLARHVVTLGGVTIIASILAILFVILYEVVPLAIPAKSALKESVPALAPDAGTRLLGVDVDEYQEIATLVTTKGISFYSLKERKELPAPEIKALKGARIVSISPLGRGPFLIGTSEGKLIPVKVNYEVTFVQSVRHVEPNLVESDPIELESDEPLGPLGPLAYLDEAHQVAVAQVGPQSLAIASISIRKNMMTGKEVKEASTQTVKLPIEGEITAFAMDNRHDNIYAGTSKGQVVRVNVSDLDAPTIGLSGQVTSGPNVPVTKMVYLLGDRTVAIGDAEGNVSTWLQATGAGQTHPLLPVNRFQKHDSAVTAIAICKRNKGFVTSCANGGINLHYSTTGETLIDMGRPGQGVAALSYAPKADGILALDAAGALHLFDLHNPHPEVTLKSLFGKVQYEGYKEPEYVWQSTGGSDDFESKLSLTPLIFGTLKASFYALFFAIPIALLGALYTSQFMHPSIRDYVKPTVEIMAGLPSVVLGFIGGLWLAPAVERVAPGIFLLPITLPLTILAALLAWRALVPVGVRLKVRPGVEVLLLVPVVLVGLLAAFWLGSVVEHTALNGDYRGWLSKTLHLVYDQRNSLVVGLAMGFAVIPIIFTISEDSLSNVPKHLSAGALALGSTRWQTATRIVLPTASPGIFSAIMIGFGRAVGETMIVLMATGNTPIMDWSIFNGFRALSANIAVELPEAPEHGTLYRVLFLAALLLFIMTFIVNTIAELVRLRLRKKYRFI
ncbi:MAG: ABC transporter permease subunit [Planctomycetota bacterium]|nr:ABC transporter permease subunit [Planctomycetota bacterium]